MAEFNAVRFFLFVSLMIFPTLALEVSLANANGDYKIDAKIGASGSHVKFTTKVLTFKVILYIVTPQRFKNIMQPKFHDERMKISTELGKDHVRFELLYMAMKDFDPRKDGPVIRQFIRDTIKPLSSSLPPNLYHFRTIGNIDLAETSDFTKYKEIPQVFGKELQHHLEAIGDTNVASCS